MKSVKYTLAALAIIALASFSSAKADSGLTGDVVFGVFNTTNSLQFDLGAYSTLTNNETWDLGNVTSVAGSNLSFSLAGTSINKNNAAGGIPKNSIVLGGVNIPTTSLASEFSSIATVEGDNGTTTTPATGHSYILFLDTSSDGSSYAFNDGANGFGVGANIDQSFTGNDSAALYLLTSNTAPVQVGTFSTITTAGDTILTFNTLAAPEPSAYALGLCAVALFFVLKRRSKVA